MRRRFTEAACKAKQTIWKITCKVQNQTGTVRKREREHKHEKTAVYFNASPLLNECLKKKKSSISDFSAFNKLTKCVRGEGETKKTKNTSSQFVSYFFTFLSLLSGFSVAFAAGGGAGARVSHVVVLEARVWCALPLALALRGEERVLKTHAGGCGLHMPPPAKEKQKINCKSKHSQIKHLQFGWWAGKT